MAAMLAAPEITKAIRDVPITVDIPTSAMLEVVDGAEQRILIDLCHALMNSLLPLVFRYLLFWHSSFKQVRTSKRE